MGFHIKDLNQLRQVKSMAGISRRLEQRIQRRERVKKDLRNEIGTTRATGLFTLDGIEELEVNANKMRKASKKTNANRIVAEYYENYYKENCKESHRPSVIENCFNWFAIDYYRLQQVKVINKVNLCHDKFCVNCQNQLSMQRYTKYKPFLDELLKDYAIYHIVFTIPNCSEVMLKSTLDKMYKKSAYLFRYFQGTKKAKDVDFSKLGYAGAIRALEIGVKQKGFLTEFHPHFHCLFLFRKGFQNTGAHINTYSFSKSHFKRDRKVEDGKRYFTDFEILLQKVWYLLYNDIKVTKKSIDELELGYSCYAQRVFKDYKDVFKYTMKGMFDEKTSQFCYSESTFRYLLEAIHRRKVIQGYGILNRFKFDDVVDEEEIDEYFAQRIIALRELEDPMQQWLSIKELIEDFDKYPHMKFISKNSLRAKVDVRSGESNDVP